MTEATTSSKYMKFPSNVIFNLLRDMAIATNSIALAGLSLIMSKTKLYSPE